MAVCSGMGGGIESESLMGVLVLGRGTGSPM